MDLAFADRGSILLAGFSYYGDPFNSSAAWTEENEIGRLWSRFTAFCSSRDEDLPSPPVPGVGYEVHLWNEETLETGQYEVFVGMELAAFTELPVELNVKTLPATTYAVFTVKGEVMLTELDQEMRRALDGAGRSRAGKYIFNLYDERYKGFENIQESVIDIYVPVI